MKSTTNILSRNEREYLAYELSKAQKLAATAAGSIGMARALQRLEKAVLTVCGKQAVEGGAE